MEGTTVQPPLVPTGAWANACQKFLNCVGIWAPESPLLPLPGASQPTDGAANASSVTTAIWTTPLSSISAVPAPAGPLQPGTLEFTDDHVHECIERLTADRGVVMAVLDHRSSPAQRYPHLQCASISIPLPLTCFIEACPSKAFVVP